MSLAMLSEDELKAAVDDSASALPGFRGAVSRYEVAGLAACVLTLFPVRAAALCGSFARNEQTPESDIDLLVSFVPGSRMGDVEAAREALEYATGRNVDLITTLAGQTQDFRSSVLHDGVKVYG